MSENSVDIYKSINKSRVWKIKNLFVKGFVVLKSIHSQGNMFGYLFSKKGARLIKKTFVKGILILANNDSSEKTKVVSYQNWLKKNMPTEEDFILFGKNQLTFNYQPKISLIVPVYNTSEDFLTATIESVFNQIYTNWELCLADDFSTMEETKSLLKKYAGKDNRIKIVFREKNGHISECSNSALALASGEFCALFDHDDLLTKDALYQVVLLLNSNPETDFIYSDEDKTTDGKTFIEPHFKPQWSPDNLLSRNYIGHLAVIRTSIIKDLGGFRKKYDGSQDYDLYLRVSEKTNKIVHLPKVLYHWRMHEKSVAANTYSKPYAYIAGQKAIEEALIRRNEPGEVEMLEEGMLGFYSINYVLKSKGKVSIIIPARNKSDLLEQCVNSIVKLSTYENFEIIVVDNASDEATFHNLIAHYKELYKEKFKCYSHNIPFNFSSLINFGASKASGEYLLLLNNDTKVVTRDWIEKMMEQAQRPSVAIVGAKLLYPDNRIQHVGVVLESSGVAKHIHAHIKRNADNLYINSVNNYPALTGACIMIRKNIFDEMSGFDENFAIEYNDIDFCLKAIDKGYYNVYLPSVELYHYESVSRGSSHSTAEKYERHLKERERFMKIWGTYIKKYSEENINLLNFN